MQIGCVVMAAGNARRFGQNKLALSLDGRSLIQRTMEAVPLEQFHRVVVVTQYPEIIRLSSAYGFAALYNPHPDWGISHTIRMGLTALRDCDSAAFLVSDQPLLRRSTLCGLLSLAREQPDRITALGHNGVRGNPCIFPKRFFPELMQLTEDHGGNIVIRAHPEQLLLWETSAEELTDVDTPAALEQLELYPALTEA